MKNSNKISNGSVIEFTSWDNKEKKLVKKTATVIDFEFDKNKDRSLWFIVEDSSGNEFPVDSNAIVKCIKSP